MLVVTACGSSAQLTSVTDAASDAADAAGDAVEVAESGEAMEEEAMEDDDAMAEEVVVSGEIAATTVAPALAESVAPADEATSDGADSDREADGENPTASSGQTPPTRTAAQRGREIIYTASVSVGVDDVEDAGAQAAQIIEDVGGFISSQNTTGGAEPRSQITFKVDPENFSVALERLAGIGELRNQTVSTDDVTERVVDLSSRIEVTQLGVNRLREAMENATDLEDFARLEQLLLARESDLEVMRGTLRTLRDRIDLATITLVLEQDRVTNLLALGVTVYEGHDKGIGCPGGRVDSRVFEPGDAVTLCFDVRNDGDQTLTGVTITETVLGIESNDDLIPVFGDASALRPGQTLLQAYELTVERDRSLRAGVTGLPTDGVTDDVVGPAVRSATTPVIRVNEDAVDPGFGDGFGAGAALLSAIWVAVKVVSGFIIPLLVLLPIFALGYWGIRRLFAARRARKQAKRMENQPPPPRESQPQTVPAAPQETGSDESE